MYTPGKIEPQYRQLIHFEEKNEPAYWGSSEVEKHLLFEEKRLF